MRIRPIHSHGRLARTAAIAAATATMLMSCAGLSPAPSDDEEHAGGPRLVGCDYVPPPPSVGGANRVLSVRVRMSVDEKGRVTHATPERRPGYPASVVEAARRTAMSCRYEPTTRDGVAVPFQTRRYFAFEIGG